MKTKVRNYIKNNRGFTLVEVIVVAVIVAVLATVAIPLYTNYVTTSKKNVADNCAASFASFIAAGIASGGLAVDSLETDYDGDGTNGDATSETSGSGETATIFIIPKGVHCDIDRGAGTVECIHKDLPTSTQSNPYRFR